MAELKPRDGSLDERLHWIEWGPTQGPAVVLVHGITGNAHNWDALAAASARSAGPQEPGMLEIRGGRYEIRLRILARSVLERRD